MQIRSVIFASAALAALACSSSPPDPYGPPPNFAAIDAQFKNPTGTFAAGQESAVLAAYSQQSSNGAMASGLFPQGSSSATAAKSAPFGLHALAGSTTPTQSFCQTATTNASGSGSCSCPGGGVIDFDFSGFAQGSQGGGSFDGVGKIAAQGCRSADGSETLDGHAFLDMRGAASQGANGAQTESLTMIYDAHFTYASPAQSGHVDMDFELDDANGSSVFAYLVNTTDGTLVVGGSWDQSTKTGAITVVDRSDTWKCTSVSDSSGKQQLACTNKEGQTRTADL